MKTIKSKSKNKRVMWTSRFAVEAWLKEVCQLDPKDFTIFEDLSVSVKTSVNLADLTLQSLPVNFKKVEGSFDISGNQLTTLEGCPEIVEKDFRAEENKLKNLLFAPHTVGGIFMVRNNQLTSLKGAPKSLKFFSCSENRLKNLIGGPEIVSGSYMCNSNRLTTLEGAPYEIGADFACTNNKLTCLEHGPVRVGGDFSVSRNKLTTFADFPEFVGGRLEVMKNNITSISTLRLRLEPNQIMLYKDTPLQELKNYQDSVIFENAQKNNPVIAEQISKNRIYAQNLNPMLDAIQEKAKLESLLPKTSANNNQISNKTKI